MSGWNTNGGAGTAAASSWDAGITNAPSWDAGATAAPSWDDGATAANDETIEENGFMTATDEAPMANGGADGEAKTCRLKVITPAIVPISRLLCAATASKKAYLPN
ncbi:MAG: hypothetical protein L6R41_008066 [Letrouitia leprolyta]|nr:MAG: hypothetical protein L6R41_008066 [Letrouitia leprolyta]